MDVEKATEWPWIDVVEVSAPPGQVCIILTSRKMHKKGWPPQACVLPLLAGVHFFDHRKMHKKGSPPWARVLPLLAGVHFFDHMKNAQKR